VIKGKGGAVINSAKQGSPAAKKPKQPGKTLIKAPSKEKLKEKPKDVIPKDLVTKSTGEKKVPVAPTKPPPFAHTIDEFDLFNSCLDSIVGLDIIKTTLTSPPSQTTST